MKNIVHPVKTDKLEKIIRSSIFGTYPVGRYNTWHGGMHIEGDKELVSIADGRIIAYQITDNYEKVTYEGKDITYSKSFMLIQYDHIIKSGDGDSKKDKPIRFYAFYQHLMPISKIESPREYPDFFCKKACVVKSKELIKGAKMYEFIEGQKTKKTFLPHGTILTLDTKETVRKKSSKGKIYTYTRVTTVDGVALEKKCYISKSFTRTDSLRKRTYVSTQYYKDPDNKTKGGRVRKEADSDSKIVNIITKGKSVEIDPKTKNDAWLKLADNSGYIHKSSVHYKNVLDNSKFTKGKVVADDIPVKSGQTIGYSGKNGILGYESFDTCHFEIFTDASDEDVKYFIENKAKNTFETPRFFELQKGATLKSNIKRDLDVKAKTPIKVVKVKGDSVKVEVIKVENSLIKLDTKAKNKDAQVSFLEWLKPCPYTSAEKRARYKIIEEKKEEVKLLFNQDFEGDDYVLCFAGYDKKTNKNGRKIAYYPEHYKEVFWVKTSDVDVSTKGEEGQIINALTEVYVNEPTSENESATVNKTLEIENKKTKNHTDKKTEEKWYYFNISYVHNNEVETKKGWISEKDAKLKIKNPHNWKEFGFEMLDAGDDWVYELVNYNRSKKNAAFMDKMWQLIDTDGNNMINRQELNNAFSNTEKRNKIAKFICKHKSEWSYTPKRIKQEAEQFYEIGINEAKNERKRKLIAKKEKLVKMLEDKVISLLCWKDIQSATFEPKLQVNESEKQQRLHMLPKGIQHDIQQDNTEVATNYQNLKNSNTVIEAPKLTKQEELGLIDLFTYSVKQEEKKTVKKDKPKRIVPKGDTFHYFHPLAFLYQMKLIRGNDLDIETGIEWLESIAISQEKANVKSNYKVLYDQEETTLRTSESDEALKYSDCSELVCRYLQKIGWSEEVKNLNTSALNKFAKRNPDLLIVQDENYIPKKGDVFLWVNHSGSNGHTGVIVDYNKNDDVVTTIEAINFKERPHGASKAINLQGVVKAKWKRTSRHLINHPTVTKRYTADPCRFITPSKK